MLLLTLNTIKPKIQRLHNKNNTSRGVHLWNNALYTLTANKIKPKIQWLHNNTFWGLQTGYGG